MFTCLWCSGAYSPLQRGSISTFRRRMWTWHKQYSTKMQSLKHWNQCGMMKWQRTYKEAKAISEANNQSETSTVHRRKERRLEGYMVESFPYHPVCFELTRRFCGVSAELMKGIQAAADDFLSEDSLLLIAKDYKITVSKEEIMVAKQLLTRRRRCHFGHGKRLQAPWPWQVPKPELSLSSSANNSCWQL